MIHGGSFLHGGAEDAEKVGPDLSQLSSRRSGVVLTAFVVAVAMLPAAMGQTKPTAAAHAQAKFAQDAEKVFQEGVPAKLPPHISTLLGLTRETDCPVKQLSVRTGKVVQGFDVSVSNKKDIILFVVDESASDQTLYLTSPTGTLRKLVRVKAGEGAVARVTGQDKNAFEKEKQFWADRLAPARASK